MSNVQQLDQALNDLIAQGKAMDAFEQYYADDVVMQENTEEPCVGKEANRERELAFFGAVEEVHKMEIVAQACAEDVSFCEMDFEATFKDGNRVRMTEVARRQWKDGKVVHERFYYKPQI